MRHFGEVLKELREGRKWSQVELARQAELSVSLVQKCEAAEAPRIRPTNYRRLAEALGLTADQLDKAWRGDTHKIGVLFYEGETYRRIDKIASKMSVEHTEAFDRIVAHCYLQLCAAADDVDPGDGESADATDSFGDFIRSFGGSKTRRRAVKKKPGGR